MGLTDEEASALYSKPNVSDSNPEWVDTLFLNDGSIQPTLCYILPVEEFDPGINKEYAEKLTALVRKIGFSEAYAREIMLG